MSKATKFIAFLLFLFLVMQAGISYDAYTARKQKEIQIEIELQREIDKEKSCIIEALWHESRSEGSSGITAVASVLQNRKNSGIYPSTYCKVINQPKQFSYTLEGKPTGKALEASVGASEQQVYTNIQDTADRLLNGTFKPSLSASVMWYHANYAKPNWSTVKMKVKRIGKHIFYKSKQEGRK